MSLYSLQCLVCIVHCALWSVQWLVSIVLCALCSVQCTVCLDIHCIALYSGALHGSIFRWLFGRSVDCTQRFSRQEQNFLDLTRPDRKSTKNYMYKKYKKYKKSKKYKQNKKIKKQYGKYKEIRKVQKSTQSTKSPKRTKNTKESRRRTVEKDKINFTKAKMSSRLKCYQNWNVTKTQMSPDLKCYQKFSALSQDIQSWHWLPWPYL